MVRISWTNLMPGYGSGFLKAHCQECGWQYNFHFHNPSDLRNLEMSTYVCPECGRTMQKKRDDQELDLIKKEANNEYDSVEENRG